MYVLFPKYGLCLFGKQFAIILSINIYQYCMVYLIINQYYMKTLFLIIVFLFLFFLSIQSYRAQVMTTFKVKRYFHYKLYKEDSFC